MALGVPSNPMIPRLHPGANPAISNQAIPAISNKDFDFHPRGATPAIRGRGDSGEWPCAIEGRLLHCSASRLFIYTCA